jgi:hypothetical protein
MKVTALNDNMLRLMNPEDRKSMGLRTKAEVLARGIIKAERDLQKQIASLLGLREIVYCWHRMDRKSTATVGWFDFTFAVRMGVLTIACGWECKLPGKELRPEQAKLKQDAASWPNGWRVRVIHSLDEAITELKELGVM